MPKHEHMLGFDFGSKKIGVAVGQTITKSAKPLSALPAKDGIPHENTIQQLVKQWGIDGFVVGLPTQSDGAPLPHVGASAKKFAFRLQTQFKLPVYLVDERYTTVNAKQILADNAGLTHARMGTVDCLAACLILEDWLKNYS